MSQSVLLIPYGELLILFHHLGDQKRDLVYIFANMAAEKPLPLEVQSIILDIFAIRIEEAIVQEVIFGLNLDFRGVAEVAFDASVHLSLDVHLNVKLALSHGRRHHLLGSHSILGH